jgi:putative transposase
MAAMDRLHLDYPFAGAMMLRSLLRAQGLAAGRARVSRLMKKMGIEAVYRKANTSRRNFAHKIYPYLLRNLTIEHANQVWALYITYLPMKRGFLYLAAVIDWHSRKILSFKLSNTMHTDLCIEAVQEAIHKYGPPEIISTDQGSQFTSLEFTDLLKSYGIQISIGGRGCWRDNVVIKRFWRSVKYDEVYLKAYQTTCEARAQLTLYIRFYNEKRGHQTLNDQTPESVYFNQPYAAKAA